MGDVLGGMWHIAKNTHMPLHPTLKGLAVYQFPYTISYAIRKRIQIDSFMELPKEKRPPKELWSKPKELEEWFDRVFDRNTQTEFTFNIDEDELEG